MVSWFGMTKLKGIVNVLPFSNTLGTGYVDDGMGMTSLRKVCAISAGEFTPSVLVLVFPIRMISMESKRTSRLVVMVTSPTIGEEDV